MKLKEGDLISFRDGSSFLTALVTKEGSSVSLYVEGRPIKIIDAKSYRVLSNGRSRYIYDYQIEKLISSKESADV